MAVLGIWSFCECPWSPKLMPNYGSLLVFRTRRADLEPFRSQTAFRVTCIMIRQADLEPKLILLSRSWFKQHFLNARGPLLGCTSMRASCKTGANMLHYVKVHTLVMTKRCAGQLASPFYTAVQHTGTTIHTDCSLPRAACFLNTRDSLSCAGCCQLVSGKKKLG